MMPIRTETLRQAQAATSERDVSQPTAARRPGSLLYKIWWRLYLDALMRNRTDVYRQLLLCARDQGYEMISLEEWAERVRQPDADKARVLVLRHDIDTDPVLAQDWIRIENEVGARASYFFRLSTLHARSIEQVAKGGGHVSYHFEELATVAKRHRVSRASQLDPLMPEIQDLFMRNADMLRRRFGWSLGIVCSHGDWMNRRLRVSSHALLRDPDFRRQTGVRHEAYDPELITPLAAYFSDDDPPHWWRPAAPDSALISGVGPVGLLTHPKLWRANLRCNLIELADRIGDAVVYRLPPRGTEQR